MRARFVLVTIGIATLVAASCTRAGVEDAERLYREGRWFELRSAVTEGSPAILRAAVATAFNDTALAETLLADVLRSEPGGPAADDAYELLCRIHRRTGQYTRLGETYRAWSAAFPDSSGVRRWADDKDKFGRPNQVNPARAHVRLRHAGEGYPTIPVSINGVEDFFILDTGAWQSALTEREAKKLGLVVTDETAVLVDSSGTPTTFRTAIADEVVIGPMRFRNVSFAVIAPTGPLADSELGIVGMPILLSMGPIHWSKDGTVELGGTTRPGDVPTNLAFDRSRLLLSSEVLGRPVRLTLDTGANSTELNENFAELFPEHVQAHGKTGSSQLAGIGGARTYRSIELPELVFTIASRPVTVRPASVTMQRLEIIGGECCVGNAGHDLLLQGRGFTLDFARMTLTVY